jgi:Fic-DOC domain mobile mystery protein B
LDDEMTQWPQPPGATPIDPSGLRDKSIRTLDQLYRAEAENVRQAHVRYFGGGLTRRMAPFDYAWLLRLHKQMFGRVWDWAGQARCGDLNLGCPWHEVPAQLQAMLADLDAWQAVPGTSALERASRLHHRAVWVHPFRNGNGRWARMLTNIWLRLSGNQLVVWPEDTMARGGGVREEYLASLRMADDGDFGRLLALHRRYSDSA